MRFVDITNGINSPSYLLVECEHFEMKVHKSYKIDIRSRRSIDFIDVLDNVTIE